MTTEASFPAHARIDKAEAVAELRRVQASGEIPRALDSLVAPLAILDAQRRVIFADNAFQDLAGAAGIEDVCGNRPGEILGCVHARNFCHDLPVKTTPLEIGGVTDVMASLLTLPLKPREM